MTTNTYEEKRQRRIDRMLSTAARLRKFAEGKDLSMFGEERSGIPMGQPILVGHHSEKRHRKHLERIERAVRAGMDALKKAEQLEQRARVAASNRAITCDNPDAMTLLKAKIEKLEKRSRELVEINKLVRLCEGSVDTLAESLSTVCSTLDLEKRLMLASKLLTPDFCGRIGFASFELTNLRSEIRRYKKRLEAIPKVQAGFEPFTVGEVSVSVVDGWVHLKFPAKPPEELRAKLKSEGFRWSHSYGVWGRRHTETTASVYWRKHLTELLKET